MIGLSIFLAVLLAVAIYLLVELWREKEDYKKWFEASKEYSPTLDITKYARGKLEVVISSPKSKLTSTVGIKNNMGVTKTRPDKGKKRGAYRPRVKNN